MLQSPEIRNPPCRTCNMASGVRTWTCAVPGAASKLVPKLPRGAFCAVFRAGSESAAESKP
eukprot:2793319-Alexandrium_andersonii.AAC.1